jgi:acyl-[acyl-carrier-protein] desaturase
MNYQRQEVMRHLEPFIAEQIPLLTRDPNTCWQPTDFMPDLSTEEGFSEVRGLQAEAAELSDEVLTVLVGDMITEEALPTYSSWIATLEGVEGPSEPRTAWGDWNRRWTAEENRHGDLLNRYLYLSGRVNMREVEVTVQHLIADGGDVKAGTDPYRTFVYTSFQEIATRVSHMNVAQWARKAGAERLYGLCSRIAGDEHRHARAYKLFISKIMEVDPNEALLAFQDMMKKKITMPAMYMRERGGEQGSSFAKFEAVAQRTGIYTARDYVDILQNLVEDWKVADLSGLSSAGEKAQEYLCGLPERYRKIVERYSQKIDDSPYTFSWIQ